MNRVDQYTLENNYRSPQLQQVLTLPGALAALKDMHEVVQNAYIDFYDQTIRPPQFAAEGARRLKECYEQAAVIALAVGFETPSNAEAARLLQPIASLEALVGDLYKVARERALIRMAE